MSAQMWHVTLLPHLLHTCWWHSKQAVNLTRVKHMLYSSLVLEELANSITWHSKFASANPCLIQGRSLKVALALVALRIRRIHTWKGWRLVGRGWHVVTAQVFLATTATTVYICACICVFNGVCVVFGLLALQPQTSKQSLHAHWFEAGVKAIAPRSWLRQWVVLFHASQVGRKNCRTSLQELTLVAQELFLSFTR